MATITFFFDFASGLHLFEILIASENAKFFQFQANCKFVLAFWSFSIGWSQHTLVLESEVNILDADLEIV